MSSCVGWSQFNFRFKSSSMETSSRHIVTLTLASCALQLIHLTPRPAVFSFDNLAIPNGVHSLVVDAPRFFHSIECGIFFQHYARPRCCCTCTGCAGSPGCVPVLGQPHFASPFVRSHFFSVAPQHSDFTLQHHFSCAVKSDFNESRSSGQYFRLCECVGRHCPRTPQLVQSLALRSIGARDGPR